MASSGCTLRMVMRVLCAEGPRDAINHINDNCEHRKGQIPLRYPGRRQIRSWSQTGPKLVADLQRAGI